jgi:hypothetical protein
MDRFDKSLVFHMNLYRIDVLSEVSSEERFRRSQTLSTVDQIRIFAFFGSIPFHLSHLISSRLISIRLISSQFIQIELECNEME